MPRPQPKPHRQVQPQAVQFEAVDPVWLGKALGLTLVVALICGYLTLCLLFYQGQWQLVLHPMRTGSSPQSIAGIPYEVIHFAPDESATPQLTGWWIPAPTGASYAKFTILFLPGADGSLIDSAPTIAALHRVGINVFSFDYRGYGESAAAHPSQRKVTEDANSAWHYLTTSRGIAAQRIIPYGFNIGASLAASLALDHPSTPALILDSPYADLLRVAERDPRSRLLPVRLLFHERFPLAQTLATLRTPKLLLSRSEAPDKAFASAAEPKLRVESVSPSQDIYAQTLTRFLDEYLPSAVPQLAPAPAH